MYTLECNYNSGHRVNQLPPRHEAGVDSARELNDAPVAGDDATALEERKERREELLRDLVDGAANASSAEGEVR